MERRSFLLASAALLVGLRECHGAYKANPNGYRGRWCSNSSCRMCAAIERDWLASHRRPSPRAAVVESVALPHIDSTPQPVVDALLKIVQPTKEDLLCDLGCGDGRICISAVKDYGCYAIGIEIVPERADLARDNAKKSGVYDRIAILTGDAREFGLGYCTIVTMYLFPDLIRELIPNTGNARAVVSVNHRMPEMNGLTQKTYKLNRATVYVSS